MRILYRIFCIYAVLACCACSDPSSSSHLSPLEEPSLPKTTIDLLASETPSTEPVSEETKEPEFAGLDSALKEHLSLQDRSEKTLYQVALTVQGETFFQGRWEIDSTHFSLTYVNQYFEDYVSEQSIEYFYRDGSLFAVRDSEYIAGEGPKNISDLVYQAHQDLCPSCGIFRKRSFTPEGGVKDSTVELISANVFEKRQSDHQTFINYHFGIIATYLDSLSLPIPDSPLDSASEEAKIDYEIALKELSMVTAFERVDSTEGLVPVTFAYNFDPELAYFLRSRKWRAW
ncbi:MAG: hypothetical protein AAF587_05445 [Bacteroidota bacterium]